jgi:large subunit ribosomal protein L22
MPVQAQATAKYIRTSAQKAGLVMDLIRGRDVNQALATLRFARKAVARDIEKVLRSAIANASQKDGFGGDVDQLFINACYANQGPSQKRIRPAPMGRAFRVIKRTAHLTVHVAERQTQIAQAVTPEPGRLEGARGRRRSKAASRGQAQGEACGEAGRESGRREEESRRRAKEDGGEGWADQEDREELTTFTDS